MSQLRVQGGRPIGGEMVAGGNKNAALPMIAATLLTDDEVVLENLPAIRDAAAMLEILVHLGARVERDGGTATICCRGVSRGEIPWDLCERTRTSFLMVAPLLSRCARVKVHPPGGDAIGRRRLDPHFYGMRTLGVQVDEEEFEFCAPRRLVGRQLFFDEASVTATEHILMAAVLAEGETTILNAAGEPHVQDLARLLSSMGADISGAGTNALTVRGVQRLHGARHRVVSDHVEAASYLALAAATGGELTVRGTSRGHYWMIRRVFERVGLTLELERDSVRLPGGQIPHVLPDAGGAVPRIDDGPWPQFPSDCMSPMLVLCTQAHGTILFFEKMFESRMYFVDPLVRMGANIIVCDPHRVVVTGPSHLRGATLRSPDIRAGMALLIAALCARGRPSLIQNAEVIDRGYENLVPKLRSLGADIERVED